MLTLGTAVSQNAAGGTAGRRDVWGLPSGRRFPLILARRSPRLPHRSLTGSRHGAPSRGGERAEAHRSKTDRLYRTNRPVNERSRRLRQKGGRGHAAKQGPSLTSQTSSKHYLNTLRLFFRI